MQGYTVVGLYTDNKQVYVTHVNAKDVAAAVDKARREMAKNGGGAVLSAFEGEHRDVYGGDELIED